MKEKKRASFSYHTQSKEKLIIHYHVPFRRSYFVHRILAFIIVKIATRTCPDGEKNRGSFPTKERRKGLLGKGNGLVIYPANSRHPSVAKRRAKRDGSGGYSVEKSILAPVTPGAQWKKNFQAEEK